MAKFRCNECRYRFSKEEIPSICPYCGRKGTIKEEESINDILNEVNSEGN